MDVTQGILDDRASISDASLDQELVAAVHVRRGRELWTLARRLGLSADEADDAVQEALTRLWQQLRRGGGIRDAEAWAFRLVYRLAMDQHRMRRRLAGLAQRLRQPAPELGPDVTSRIAVWTEVGHLPERQRAVLYLRYRSDLSFEQIGTVMGISPSAARSYASTGVARIRHVLANTEGEDG
jgi:RNA polymerase sigma factor (sigma-70 family)